MRTWTRFATERAELGMADRRRVLLRDRARLDVDEAVDWYRDHADVNTTLAFVEAVGAGLRRTGEHPAMGSPRYATELDLPGLRSCLLDGFPYVVFYVEQAEHLDVWRVVHARRDIPTWLHEREPPPARGAGERDGTSRRSR